MDRPRVDRPTHGAAPGVSPPAGRPLPPAEADVLDLTGDEPGPLHELDRIDPTFVADFAESQATVDAVERYFAARGYPTVKPAPRVRPTAGDWRAYVDHGDLFVGQRLECRYRRERFTRPEEYPYATVLVADCSRVDGVTPRAWYYFVANADNSVALVINVARTRAQWVREWIEAGGRWSECYFCPRELTVAVRLPPP